MEEGALNRQRSVDWCVVWYDGSGDGGVEGGREGRVGTRVVAVAGNE